MLRSVVESIVHGRTGAVKHRDVRERPPIATIIPGVLAEDIGKTIGIIGSNPGIGAE